MHRLAVAGALLLLAFAANGADVECTFASENRQGGRANDASCTGDPDVFRRADRSEHCRVGSAIAEILDFSVDMTAKTVTWSERLKLSQTEVQASVDRVTAKGLDRDAARNQVERGRTTRNEANLLSHDAKDVGLLDDELGRPAKGRTQREHVFTFMHAIYGLHTLFVSEVGRKAILVRWSSEPTWSSAALYFGTCILGNR